LFFRLAGKRVLVVGAGAVGVRKARELREAGAFVHWVDPHPSAEAIELAGVDASISLDARAFSTTDLEGVWLVVSCVNDPLFQADLRALCEHRRLWLLAVDDAKSTMVAGASIVRREPFTIAISSHGELPALTRLVRTIVESALPPATWVAQARALRARWKAAKTPMNARFGELVAALINRR
jgi:uroporphyrin-III C-methyltransferase/precorrin-2 dehydrogenase/sirohydrochlorin ferrochelatase